jgi:hypothetical protein
LRQDVQPADHTPDAGSCAQLRTTATPNLPKLPWTSQRDVHSAGCANGTDSIRHAGSSLLERAFLRGHHRMASVLGEGTPAPSPPWPKRCSPASMIGGRSSSKWLRAEGRNDRVGARPGTDVDQRDRSELPGWGSCPLPTSPRKDNCSPWTWSAGGNAR